MPALPPHHEQIVQAHAQLIVSVVTASLRNETPPDLEHALQVSMSNGWTELVLALRKILAGERNPAALQPLDEEDTVIVEAILGGIQGTRPLPDPERSGDATLAAPGLARLIHESASGQPDALRVTATLAEQMAHAGGDMARIAGLLKRLVDGERDPDHLAQSLGPQGESLLFSILDELGKLERH